MESGQEKRKWNPDDESKDRGHETDKEAVPETSQIIRVTEKGSVALKGKFACVRTDKTRFEDGEHGIENREKKDNGDSKKDDIPDRQIFTHV